MSFISLDDFHKRVLRLEEPLSPYVHELKQLLNQAMPEITAQTAEQLLLHQFLTGLPQEVSKQLRATGATDTLKTALERAKILMTVEQHTPVNPVATAQPKPTTEFHQLQQQITELTAQVAALTTRQASPRTPPAFRENRPTRCFICNRVGHLQYNCPTQDSVLLVDSKAMAGKLAHRETARGRPPQAAVVPVSKPTTSHGGHSEEQCHSDHGEGGRSCR